MARVNVMWVSDMTLIHLLTFFNFSVKNNFDIFGGIMSCQEDRLQQD